LLATNPRISQLAGMVKHYAPLKTKFGIDMVKLLATTSEFDALPQWLQDHLLKVEQLVEQDKANVIEKHGKHNQKTHGRKGSRASFEAVSFTGSELSSIATYTKATIQVNRQLRGISRRGIAPSVFDLSENEMDSVIDNLDSAIDKSRLAEKMELGREMPLSMLKRGSVKRSAGKVISDKGFLSLRSTVSSVPPRTGFAKFRVTAPAGTKALDLSFLTPNSMGEIIFPRETKIKINSITGQDDDMVIRGEIVE